MLCNGDEFTVVDRDYFKGEGLLQMIVLGSFGNIKIKEKSVEDKCI